MEAAQFSSVRATLLDLGMAMTLGREVHQLRATWAGVLPVSAASACRTSCWRPRPSSLPAARRRFLRCPPELDGGGPVKSPLARGV